MYKGLRKCELASGILQSDRGWLARNRTSSNGRGRSTRSQFCLARPIMSSSISDLDPRVCSLHVLVCPSKWRLLGLTPGRPIQPLCPAYQGYSMRPDAFYLKGPNYSPLTAKHVSRGFRSYVAAKQHILRCDILSGALRRMMWPDHMKASSPVICCEGVDSRIPPLTPW